MWPLKKHENKEKKFPLTSQLQIKLPKMPYFEIDLFWRFDKNDPTSTYLDPRRLANQRYSVPAISMIRRTMLINDIVN
jgi:hypothetical protein